MVGWLTAVPRIGYHASLKAQTEIYAEVVRFLTMGAFSNSEGFLPIRPCERRFVDVGQKTLRRPFARVEREGTSYAKHATGASARINAAFVECQKNPLANATMKNLRFHDTL